MLYRVSRRAHADICITATVACHDSGLQALASCQPSAASVHSRGKEDGRRKLSRHGLGSVSGIVRCPIVDSMAVMFSEASKKSSFR